MTPDLSFRETDSVTCAEALLIYETGRRQPWGTLYRREPGGPWTLERRLSSTASRVTETGCTDKTQAMAAARDLARDLARHRRRLI